MLNSKSKERLERFLLANKANKKKAAGAAAAAPAVAAAAAAPAVHGLAAAPMVGVPAPNGVVANGQDGIEVSDADLPEFWARVEKLKGNLRTEAVAALNARSKERLEEFLLSR